MGDYRAWTLIGVRNPSDSGTHVCVLVDEPPLNAGERVEVVPAEQLEGAVEAWRETWDALASQVDHDNACPDDGTCELCRLAPPTTGGR